MKKLLALLAFTLLMVANPATAQDAYVEGTDYEVIATQASAIKEVKEYFWYGCPHCYNNQAVFDSLRSSLPAQVLYTQVPASWNQEMEFHAKAYYAAQAMSAGDRFNPAMYSLLFVERKKAANSDQLRPTLERLGIDVGKFQSAFGSFPVQANIVKAKNLARAERVNDLPMITVNGKYKILPNSGIYNNTEALSRLVKFLLNQN